MRKIVGTQESRIQLSDGDIFNCLTTENLAYCVRRDCSIGAGMVTLFEAKVAGVKDLLSHTRKAGDCVVLKRGNRFVYCLVTKDSTLQRSMCTSLEAMRNHCIAHGITKVSVPWNGCGLETLNWGKGAEDSGGCLPRHQHQYLCLLMVCTRDGRRNSHLD